MNRDVRRYINAVKDERRLLFDKLHALILGMYPTAETAISYGIVKYRIAPGRVWLGYWKRGVSLHTGYPALIAQFRATHPAIKTGKGGVNLSVTDRIPARAIQQLIRRVVNSAKKPVA